MNWLRKRNYKFVFLPITWQKCSSHWNVKRISKIVVLEEKALRQLFCTFYTISEITKRDFFVPFYSQLLWIKFTDFYLQYKRFQFIFFKRRSSEKSLKKLESQNALKVIFAFSLRYRRTSKQPSLALETRWQLHRSDQRRCPWGWIQCVKV